jgi:hypothetical protein
MGFNYRTWGNSWGESWLNSWGLGAAPTVAGGQRATYGSKGEYPGSGMDAEELIRKRNNELALAFLLDEF